MMNNALSRIPLMLVLLASSVLAQSLTGIRIDGLDTVEEHTSGIYRVFATFDDDVEYEVTLFSSLSVSPGVHASINEFGVLMVLGVSNDEVGTILAEFEHGGVGQDASHEIRILDTLPPAGRALDFDGGDDVAVVPAASSLGYAQGGWTIEAWLSPDNMNPELATPIFGQLSLGIPARDPYSLELGDGEVSFRVDDSLGASQKLSYPIAEGQWVHVAGVYDPDHGTAALFVNGDKVVSEPISVLMESSDSFPIIMGGQGDGPRAYDGQLDEVRIWRIARSYCEIRGNWRRPLQGTELGLVGYWRFDTGGTQTIADAGPFGNHGTLGREPSSGADDPNRVASLANVSLGLFRPADWTALEPVTEVSSSNDWGVSVSGDLLELYIGSERDAFAETEIYRATRTSRTEAFSVPTVVEALSIPGYEQHEGNPCLSQNGLRIYFLRHQGHGPGDLYVAERAAVGAPWGAPVPIDSLNTLGNDWAMTVSGDELYAVLASERGGSLRFWTASRDSLTSPWGNLSVIQSLRAYAPRACSLTADGLTLYVAAEIDTELGGLDIWRARRNSVDSNFGTPVHMPQLSTPSTEWGLSISPDGSTFFVATGSPRGNIYTSSFEVIGAPVDGEMDCDGDLDLDDHREYVSCLTGPGNPVSLACELADLDGDGDSDLRDFQRFIAALLNSP